MSVKKYKLNQCLDHEQLIAFVQGHFSKTESKLLEKHLLDCELCSDAIDGLRSTPTYDFSKSISVINRKIDNRITDKSNFWLSLAACIVLLIVAGGVILLSMQKSDKPVLSELPKQELRSKEAASPVISKEESYQAVEKEVKPLLFSKEKAKAERKEPSKPIPELAAGTSVGNGNGFADINIEVPSVPSRADIIAYPESFAESADKENSDWSNEMLAFAEIQVIRDDEPAQVPLSIATESKVSGKKAKMFRKESFEKSMAMEPMRNDEESFSLQEGIEFYKNKDYAKAIMIFNGLLARENSNKTSLLLRSMAKIRLGKAEEVLNDIERNSSAFQYTDIKWIKAITLLENGEKEKALEVLEDISEGSSPFREKAIQIKEKLKR